MTPNQRRLAILCGDISAFNAAELKVLTELLRWSVPPREEELCLAFGGEWWLQVAVDLEEFGLVEIIQRALEGTKHGDLKLTDEGRKIAEVLTPPRAVELAGQIDAIRREREERSTMRRIKRVVGKGGNPNTASPTPTKTPKPRRARATSAPNGQAAA